MTAGNVVFSRKCRTMIAGALVESQARAEFRPRRCVCTDRAAPRPRSRANRPGNFDDDLLHEMRAQRCGGRDRRRNGHIPRAGTRGALRTEHRRSRKLSRSRPINGAPAERLSDSRRDAATARETRHRRALQTCAPATRAAAVRYRYRRNAPGRRTRAPVPAATLV